MNTDHIVLATNWGETAIAITVIAFVGALVLLALWQIASIIKKGMDLRGDRDATSGKHCDAGSPPSDTTSP